MMNNEMMTRSLIAGVVTLVVGIVVTFMVNVAFPTTNLVWSMIAVGFASFFSGFAGYYFGMNADNGETVYNP
jgi:ABC-type antimicrobial peptide transport system permease subunit